LKYLLTLEQHKRHKKAKNGYPKKQTNKQKKTPTNKQTKYKKTKVCVVTLVLLYNHARSIKSTNDWYEIELKYLL
jgi:hypothetical protein